MNDQRGKENTGGTMRLGNYNCNLNKASLTYELYKQDKIIERHRHRGECNPKYTEEFDKWGIKISGINPDNKLVEIIEAKDHPFFVGCQFHPEFKSMTSYSLSLLRFLVFSNSVESIQSISIFTSFQRARNSTKHTRC